MITIQDKIKKFKSLEKHRKYITGQKYYDTENEVIMKRKFIVAYSTKGKTENSFSIKTMEDVFKANGADISFNQKRRDRDSRAY